MRKATRLYLALYCDERGCVRPEAEPILSMEAHYAFVRHVARLSPKARNHLYDKWTRRNGKDATHRLEQEVSAAMQHPRVFAREHRKALKEAMLRYAESLPDTAREEVHAAWLEKYGSPLIDEPTAEDQKEEEPSMPQGQSSQELEIAI